MNRKHFEKTLAAFKDKFGIKESDKIWKKCFYNAERSYLNKMSYRLLKFKQIKEKENNPYE